MAGRLLKFQQDDIITLTFTGGMRNISAGAVLAITYFPPQVAVPVVLGMLFQQVLASFYGRMLEKVYHHALTEKKYAANAK
jgi:BASS family bile acid:Na+ symporter